MGVICIENQTNMQNYKKKLKNWLKRSMDHQENTNIFDSQQFDIQLVPIDSQILDWNPNKQKQHEVHKQEQSYND